LARYRLHQHRKESQIFLNPDFLPEPVARLFFDFSVYTPSFENMYITNLKIKFY